MLPEKEAFIPSRPKEYTPKAPVEFVRNVWGSSAGAGSGEFHVYRGTRRREYARQKFMTEKTEKEKEDAEYHRKLEANKQAAESKTAKKRAKSTNKEPFKDSNALYIADYDTLKGSLLQSKEFSAIRSDECKPRSLEELEKLEAASRPVITEQPAKVTTMNGTSGSKPKPKQPAGIAGMFSNVSKKKEDKEENKKEDGKGDQEQKETVPDKGKGKHGGIGSFFSKQQNKEPTTKSETTKVEPSVKKDSAVTVKPQRDLNKKSPPKRGQKSKKTRKQDSDEEDAAPQKQKRRRIQVVESSSEEEEEDEVIPESPVPSPVADIPSSPEPEKMEEEEEEEKVEEVKKTGNSHAQASNKHESSEKHRVKRRKKVTNTYMDKQGFMVTEEVWETASTDASDIDEPTKPAPVTAPKSKQESSDKSGNKDKKVQPTKKKTSPDPKHSGKQTSLMSFFKKK
ncbi:DNA polymerase delta subunit 3-like [Lingula anatina]|uniref:DNA polymerase delta subunit 3-like n=1 Tax=Lingula anatina TaxID=7574 RepID=A0A1S3JZL6_LINAN|nr:DNA polymerase delta subunit 3-like [Lingula anatina]|eukprot:XP_013415838.1 DNA polymerase delta subunit 3-like [Lingula anatina]